MGKRYRQFGKQAFKLGTSCRPLRQNLPAKPARSRFKNGQNPVLPGLPGSWHGLR
jgi:hypothetical protein